MYSGGDLHNTVTKDGRRPELSTANRALKHLKRHLGLYKVKNLAADVLTAYVAARREESASEATIRYELAVLKKGMGLAVRAEKLDRKPPFPSPEG
jgi:hypothetical protein